MAFNEEGKGQHVAVDGFAANAFACIALCTGEKDTATLIRSGKASTWRGTASITGEGGVGT